MAESKSDDNYTQCLKKGSKYINMWGNWPFNYITGIPKFMMWAGKMSYNRLFIKSNEELNEILPIYSPYFMKHLHPENDSQIKATWLGHASILLEIEGFRILCDPIFSKQCGPMIGISRYRNAPCSVRDLPDIDAVVISHNHYDHMDYHTIRELNEIQRNLTWLIPDGDLANIKGMFGNKNDTIIREMKWWQEHELVKDSNRKLIIAFTPTQHWSNRGVFDTFKSLWGSWAFIGKKSRFWFGGDTGYCGAFKEIGKKYGPFDGAAIPIGAYKPRDLLKYQHVDPDEAVEIHIDIKSRVSFGIHWGTFPLSDECYNDPKDELENVVSERNSLISKPEDKIHFITINHGQTISISNDNFSIIPTEKRSSNECYDDPKVESDRMVGEKTSLISELEDKMCLDTVNHGQTESIENDNICGIPMPKKSSNEEN